MSNSPTDDHTEQPVENTDTELWRERPDDYYAHSIHVTNEGSIGINVGGYVIVQPLEDWHRQATHYQDRQTPDACNCGFWPCRHHSYPPQVPELDAETELRLEQAKKRMDWDEERFGEPTLLEYLRYYRSGEIGEIHIQAAIQAQQDRLLDDLLAALPEKDDMRPEIKVWLRSKDYSEGRNDTLDQVITLLTARKEQK